MGALGQAGGDGSRVGLTGVGRSGSVVGSVTGLSGSVVGRSGSVVGRRGSVMGKSGSIVGFNGSVVGPPDSGSKGSESGMSGSRVGMTSGSGVTEVLARHAASCFSYASKHFCLNSLTVCSLQVNNSMIKYLQGRSEKSKSVGSSTG